ncbi:MAG TPA: CotO family spore coat protein [Bacillota bacterium]|nr:CotO family spore coat protein [Bacillota bacterium]
MEEDVYAKEPLFYIKQPDIKSKLVNMQANYFVTENINEDKKEKAPKHTIVESSIETKVDDILQTMEYIPDLRCSISAGDEIYRGKIEKREGKQVYFFDAKMKQEKVLPLANIKEIKIISF